MEKIVYDCEFEENVRYPYDSMGTLRIVYGKPVVNNGQVEISKIGDVSLEIKSNRLYSTLGRFAENYLENKYPDALILSKADYALSNNETPVKKLARKWKRNFRRKKITNFFGRIVNSDLYKRVFHRKKYWQEVRNKRIDYYFSNPILTSGYQTTLNPNIEYEKK